MPLCFSFRFTVENVRATVLGFLAFSLMASAIYIMNDLRDVEKDRNHPRKKNRPIASGKVSPTSAIVCIVLLLVGAIALHLMATNLMVGHAFTMLLLYFILNVWYSFGAKNIPILDVMILTAGFLIRVYYGAFLIGVAVSHWLFLTIMSAALFMGLGKRKKEYQTKGDVREVLMNYNEKFLGDFMNVCLALVIMFYSLWTIEQNVTCLFLSIPLLIAMLMEYMLYMEKGDEGDPITVLLGHPYLVVTVLVYIIFMGTTLFLAHQW